MDHERVAFSTIIVKMFRLCLVRAAALALWLVAVPAVSSAQTVVRFDTVEGSFDVELFDDAMPRSVTNFLFYVNDGRYDGSVVHRNAAGFVIQGGGFFLSDPVPPVPTEAMSFRSVVPAAPILDEPGGGIAGPSNVRGTIAMAKDGPNTVTSQWFINQGDNLFLDDPQRPDGGFSAFGAVLGEGMEVVDAIGALPVPPDFGFTIGAPFNNQPLRNFSGSSIVEIRAINTVIVHSVTVVPEPSSGLLAAASLLTLLALRTWGIPLCRTKKDCLAD